MKIGLLVFIVLHGLIHLTGFVKAFNLSEVRQLSLLISKAWGVIWLLAAILFLLAALLLGLKNNNWYVFSIIAIILSQTLIVVFWQDARFGTIANIIILAVAISAWGKSYFYSSYVTAVKKALTQPAYFKPDVITEAHITHLPEPVKRYLRYTGCIGKPFVNNFTIEMTGKIRKNELSAWMPLSSEQYNFMHTPARLYFLNAVMKGFPVAGFHRYLNGRAAMDIRLLSLFKVQYQAGAEMDTSETVTFFNDMCCMAPPTLLDNRIKWLKNDGNKVYASFTNNNITINAWLYFNDEGQLTNFVSHDRYSADAKRKLPWSTPLNDYKNINGYNLFSQARAVYSHPEREETYATFQLNNIQYNCR